MNTFATALNCIDGRIQLPVIRQVQELSSAEYVDMITETGIDRLLTDEAFRKTIQQKMDISIEKHGSKFIAVGRTGYRQRPPETFCKASTLSLRSWVSGSTRSLRQIL